MSPVIRLPYKKTYYTVILIYVFFLGGMVQFFIGISNTISTYLIGATVIVIQFIISIDSFKIFKASIVTQFAFLMVTYIFVNGIIINNIGFTKPIIYIYFVFLPLAATYIVDYFLTNPIRKKNLIKLLTIVALIQLPVLVIQKFSFDLFSNIRFSNKVIHEIDFSFGTFFMANDHALGFFLICFLLYSFKKFNGIRLVCILVWVVISILLTNSKASYLLLFISLLYLLITHFNISKKFILALIPLGIYFVLKNIDLFEVLNLNNAENFYNTGEASRQQIILILLSDGISFFGHGPYSYFNIETGEFLNAKNFSQWIWNYFDLGLIGLLFFIVYTFIIYFRQPKKNEYAMMIVMYLFFYGFFTNYTTDIGMMLTFLIFIRT